MSHGLMALSPFAAIVGDGNCVADPQACAEFAVDGLTPRCVVFPRSEDEAARALKRAAEHDLAVVACGNGTKLGTGNAPRRYDVALSLRRMNRVVHFEPADLTVSVEAGVTLGDFQQFLRPHALWVPLDPPGGPRSTLGGLVAANASGPLRLRYGSPRDFVLGMRVGLTDGKLVKAGGRVVKNVAGYDLSRLLTGSYGTLGVITEISLKLFPLPSARATWRILPPDLEAARQIRRKILQSSLNPMRMVLLDAGAAAIARGESLERSKDALEIRVEAGGSEQVIKRFAETLRALAGDARSSVEVLETGAAETGWKRIADFGSLLTDRDSPFVALKAALPIASGESFVELIAGEADKLRARRACFCQNGVGVVRACLVVGELSSELTGSIARLRADAVGRGGALIVEQCPPALKRELDVWGAEGSDFGLMSKLKQLWDSKGTLAPGRFVGGL